MAILDPSPLLSSSSSTTTTIAPPQDQAQPSHDQKQQQNAPLSTGSLEENGFDHAAGRSKKDDEEEGDDSDGEEEEEEELSDLFSKLNPHAKEFVPLSHSDGDGDGDRRGGGGGDGCSPDADNDSKTNRKKKNGSVNNKRRTNNRLYKAQWDASIRRTVYVSDIDHQVTEEQLAALFLTCGQVVDCRVCGDPNSVLRFAFVEFTDEDGAGRALSLAGTMLGFYPVKVLPSKTAIIPVNPTFLPQSEDEREMCARTVYCTNIDKKVSQADVKLFFEFFCGEVARLRLLGEHRQSTRIAFVEFVLAESAIAALNCSGAILGSLPIRVSPSKTPVRPCMSRQYFI